MVYDYAMGRSFLDYWHAVLAALGLDSKLKPPPGYQSDRKEKPQAQVFDRPRVVNGHSERHRPRTTGGIIDCQSVNKPLS